MIQRLINSNAKSGKKSLAILIDPDELNQKDLIHRIDLCNTCKVDFIFFGGSLVDGNHTQEVVGKIKLLTDIPVVLFPGSPLQICSNADAILFLSLVSGRNPEYLIGSQVVAAPYIKKSKVETLSTAYMLIEGGSQTTASYISGSMPIPRSKNSIALATAQASEMLGFSNIYMDAGSGADLAISPTMIKTVKSNIDLPLIIGGGIKTSNQLEETWNAGADIAVVGNVVEEKPELIHEFSQLKFSI